MGRSAPASEAETPASSPKFTQKADSPVSSPGVLESAKNAVLPGSKVAFTGGDQGFVSLVLENVEMMNHNTKKFTFKLPEEDMQSGLHVASALLTKFKGPEMEKAVLRPYTPISDESELWWDNRAV